ncbi:hypothetical protein L3X38_013666 [Prunus dulcis]|uniref:Retrovirus-related Pol polyprotein from transposon TNT 1-94-like beta-barrel domain-containing protein n=1 Tax=Prunus dulcis TaxID=3755 RepID=A0AAD4ZH89_PRUDU|nr:hypothetical protein L3X38_013666 [Prunus dulcis]
MGDNSIVAAVTAAYTNLCVSDSIPGTDSNIWIIDTGASDHMTYDAKFFDELSSNTRDPYITSANGLPSPITGEGTISLTPTLSLFRALLFPNIHCNLLSVGRLLDTLNASATFYHTHCSFQDLKTHETIGHEFCTMVSTQFHARVKVFLTDNGGECVNNTLASFFHAQEVPYYVSPSSPIQEERGSELESLGLENDLFEDTALGKETTCRTEASDRSPISEDETCGPCEEMTDRHLELDQSPISGDEANALNVKTTSHTEASDQSPISNDNDSFTPTNYSWET